MFPTRHSPGLIEVSDMPQKPDMEKAGHNMPSRTAVILGVTADIGKSLAERLLSDGWRVEGLGRSQDRLGTLSQHAAFRFTSCDLADRHSINSAVNAVRTSDAAWNLFVSCAGTMEPIGKFFSLDFDQWESSVIVNSTAQLRVLHGLWPSRSKSSQTDIMLMAGGGTNSPFTNYSAYCLSKISLIKMCELIDDEEPEANAFIIGPGFVQTRIHRETLNAGENAGEGYHKTLTFLETPGTSFDDIYDNMRWCMAAGREVAGGRNFSTVHDGWRDGGDVLKHSLQNNRDAFRLRRKSVEQTS